MSKPNQNNPTAYALRMTMSDGLELYYNSKRCVATIKTGKNKIGLFATSQDAELVRTVRNIKASELYDVVLITFVGSRVDIGTPQQSEPKQHETAKDSPTQGGAIYDKTKCAAYEKGEEVLNKSTFDWLKHAKPAPKQARQNKPAKTEPQMTEKEQELLGKLNNELAKFTSLDAFNADRKNFFLPPVGKPEFDKMKAAIECTIAIAKMVRPDYFDKISQIKVPTSEQPKAEPKQGSDGADSPKFGKCRGGFTKGKFANSDANELDAKLRELDKALPKFTSFESDKEFSEIAFSRLKQGNPKPSFQSQLDQYHAELSAKIISEMNKTMEFWAGIFGLQASKQDKPKQPEINHYDPAKATLNKIVLGRIKEMEKWLGEREYNTTEIAKYIQVCVDDLGLDLADFRRKNLDLGAVEHGEVEPKEVEQGETAQIWAVYNSETNLWLRRVLNDAYWQPENAEHSGFGSKELAEANIKWLHENGTLRAKIEHCKAVSVEPKETGQCEEKQPQTNQSNPQKDGAKLGEADGSDSAKLSLWIIQTNPSFNKEFTPFYLEYVDKHNVVSHTPEPKNAMKFRDALDADNFLNRLISDSSCRYRRENFNLHIIDNLGVVTTQN
jgi:hypothetical protein